MHAKYKLFYGETANGSLNQLKCAVPEA